MALLAGLVRIDGSMESDSVPEPSSYVSGNHYKLTAISGVEGNHVASAQYAGHAISPTVSYQ